MNLQVASEPKSERNFGNGGDVDNRCSESSRKAFFLAHGEVFVLDRGLLMGDPISFRLAGWIGDINNPAPIDKS